MAFSILLGQLLIGRGRCSRRDRSGQVRAPAAPAGVGDGAEGAGEPAEDALLPTKRNRRSQAIPPHRLPPRQIRRPPRRETGSSSKRRARRRSRSGSRRAANVQNRSAHHAAPRRLDADESMNTAISRRSSLMSRPRKWPVTPEVACSESGDSPTSGPVSTHVFGTHLGHTSPLHKTRTLDLRGF